MGFKWVISLCLLALLALSLNGKIATAREPERGETVLERPRTPIEPIGIPAGGFRFYPQLDYTELYDDNIFATPIDTQSDFISIISPKATLRSNWPRHMFKLSANADIVRFRDFSQQNFVDWRIASDIHFDVTPDMKVFAGGEFLNLNQPRSSPDDVRGLEPAKYASAKLFAHYLHRLGRFSFAPKIVFQQIDYDDVPAIRNDQTVMIDQDFRDRDIYTIELRGGYELVPKSSEFFFFVRRFDRDYEQSQSIPLNRLVNLALKEDPDLSFDISDPTDFPLEFNRSSIGYEFAAGVTFDLRGIIFGDVFAGYREQKYDSPLSDIETPIFGVSIDWNLTRLTTIRLKAKRDIGEVTQPLYSGFISTMGSITIDHELRRNLLLNASVSVAENDYEGTKTPVGTAKREDRIHTVDIEAKYLINRTLYASLGYKYQQRDSSDNTLSQESLNKDYKIHAIFIGLEAQY